MVGLIIYKDKAGNEKEYYFTGMKYGESTTEFLERRNVEYSEIKECNIED